jgi:hypothetical protein
MSENPCTLVQACATRAAFAEERFVAVIKLIFGEIKSYKRSFKLKEK